MMMEQGITILAICTLSFYGWYYMYHEYHFKTYSRGWRFALFFIFNFPFLSTNTSHWPYFHIWWHNSETKKTKTLVINDQRGHHLVYGAIIIYQKLYHYLWQSNNYHIYKVWLSLLFINWCLIMLLINF